MAPHRQLNTSALQATEWPTFTEAQVSFLEKLFPPRCLGPMEAVESHLRYAGKVDLVQTMRSRVVGNSPTTSVGLTEDEEEAALDAEAVEAGLAQQRQE